MTEDSQLITRLKGGDTRALSALYERYSGALYGVIYRICKDEAMAQDLLQETFVKIWKNVSSYDPEKGKFYTWGYKVARNTTLNALRNPSKLIQKEDLSVYKDKAEEDGEQADFGKLKGYLSQLEDHHQKALELVYFQGLTHREAHKEMNVPLGTFKSYVQQALKKLRDAYGTKLSLGWILIEWML